MGPIGCPETSVQNYRSTLRNTPKEHRSHEHRDGGLKSRKIRCVCVPHHSVLNSNNLFLFKKFNSLSFATNIQNKSIWATSSTSTFVHSVNKHHKNREIGALRRKGQEKLFPLTGNFHCSAGRPLYEVQCV
jgi:hypothetical protein